MCSGFPGNAENQRWRAQVSSAMGFGFRCGFLGLLHMEIVQERLEREYDLDLIITAPTVVYRCQRADGTEINVDNPCNLPDKHENLQEPYCRCAPGAAPPLAQLCSPKTHSNLQELYRG